MLMFTQAQLKTFQNSWQIDKLQVQLTEVMEKLADQHESFYFSIKPEQHLYYGRQLIREAVSYGFSEIEHIYQLLDLEYGVRKRIYTKPTIQPLYHAVWLEPQDRINAIRYLVTTDNIQFNEGNSIYGSLENYSLGLRCQDIRQAEIHNSEESPRTKLIQMLRQALYLALLDAELNKKPQTGPAWQAWMSNWEEAQVGIEHPGYQRRIQLQAANNQVLRVEPDDEGEIPVLMLYIPDQLSDPQIARFNEILHAWTLDLLPVETMRKSYAAKDTENQKSSE